MTSTLSDVVEPSPVFVDESGRRGRRLRGLGWIAGVAFVGVTLAMISGLLGTQSDAPTFTVPRTADTLPPGQYVDAPLPAPPGRAAHGKGAPLEGAPGIAAPTASSAPTTTTSPTATATTSASADTPATAASSPTQSPHHTTSPAASSPSAHPSRTTSAAPTHESATTSAPPPSKTATSSPAVPDTAS